MQLSDERRRNFLAELLCSLEAWHDYQLAGGRQHLVSILVGERARILSSIARLRALNANASRSAVGGVIQNSWRLLEADFLAVLVPEDFNVSAAATHAAYKASIPVLDDCHRMQMNSKLELFSLRPQRQRPNLALWLLYRVAPLVELDFFRRLRLWIFQ